MSAIGIYLVQMYAVDLIGLSIVGIYIDHNGRSRQLGWGHVALGVGNHWTHISRVGIITLGQ